MGAASNSTGANFKTAMLSSVIGQRQSVTKRQLMRSSLRRAGLFEDSTISEQRARGARRRSVCPTKTEGHWAQPAGPLWAWLSTDVWLFMFPWKDYGSVIGRVGSDAHSLPDPASVGRYHWLASRTPKGRGEFGSVLHDSVYTEFARRMRIGANVDT